MTSTMAKTGFVEVDEGRLFWKYDSPKYYKDSTQVGPRPRPVLLFIHVNTLSEFNSSPFITLLESVNKSSNSRILFETEKLIQ